MTASELKPIGQPSPGLTPAAKREWRRIVRSLPEGTITECDRLGMELYCQQWLRVQSGEALSAPELTQIRLLLGDLGLLPTSRRRLKISAKPAELDPFDELMKRRKAQEVAAL